MREQPLGQSASASHLVISTTATPNGYIRTYWLPTDEETVVVLDIFGLRFAVNLQATAFGLPTDVPIEGAAEFWLGVRDGADKGE